MPYPTSTSRYKFQEFSEALPMKLYRMSDDMFMATHKSIISVTIIIPQSVCRWNLVYTLLAAQIYQLAKINKFYTSKAGPAISFNVNINVI